MRIIILRMISNSKSRMITILRITIIKKRMIATQSSEEKLINPRMIIEQKIYNQLIVPPTSQQTNTTQNKKNLLIKWNAQKHLAPTNVTTKSKLASLIKYIQQSKGF